MWPILITLFALIYLVLGALTVAVTMKYLGWNFRYCEAERIVTFLFWPPLTVGGILYVMGIGLNEAIKYTSALAGRLLPRD